MLRTSVNGERAAPRPARPSLARRLGGLLLAGVVVAPVPLAAQQHRPCLLPEAPAMEALLRNRVEVLRTMGGLLAGGERIRARVALPEAYLRHDWAPLWVDGQSLTACGRRLVDRIRGAGDDGLEPEDYHAGPIERLVDEGARDALSVDRSVDLDLLLTDAFLTLGSHLSRGRVNPVSLEAEWLANRRELDMAQVLEGALSSGDIAGVLNGLRPSQPGYLRLQSTLAHLEAVVAEGGWGEVSEGPTLRQGDSDPRAASVRTRLRLAGDLPETAVDGGPVFDAELAAAVARFQLRHGLDVDSAVGARTRAAMNVPAEQRLEQVRINLERWRWLPDDLGARHIRVNIADYRVEVWDRGEVSLRMRAVVGRNYRQTPSFSARMSYLVLSPFWHVPPGIAANDKLPELQRDPGYLARQQMTLLSQATNAPVDPATVDFGALSGGAFNRQYRLRQDPGPLNALGQVKFMFPNRHNVYLHDTPSRELFSRTERAFSSGCIRLERPLDLAAVLLAGDPRWTPERIRAVADGGRETTVNLDAPVPVHLLYWTAFVDDEGRVHFRPDIYQRDTRVRSALLDEPPEL